MRFVFVGGEDTPLCLSQCKRNDLEGPDILIYRYLANFIDTDDLGESPQRGRQVSCVGEIRQRQTKSGVDLVIWMVAEKRIPCCGWGRVFITS